jgi:alpha-glucoside transport system permease protein
MEGIAGTRARLVWAITSRSSPWCCCGSFPTVGLLVSSFRDADQIAASRLVDLAVRLRTVGALCAPPRRSRRSATRAANGSSRATSVSPEGGGRITGWGTSSRAARRLCPRRRRIGRWRALTRGRGWQLPPHRGRASSGDARQRVFYTAVEPPAFTTDNYREVLLTSEGMGKAFFNTLTVTIPATIIPILIAAFAAYALAWMEFPGRALLIAAVVGLLVVPLQLALIPLLRLHNEIGIGKGYLGVWLAHTGFGLPLAIYLLRNYMVGLPRDIIETPGRRRHRFPDFHQDHPAAVLPGAGQFRDLPVPVDVERSAGRQGVPDRRDRRNHGDDRPDRRAAGHARRQLGNPGHLGLRLDRGAADRVLRDAEIPRARPAGRLGEVKGGDPSTNAMNG